VELICRSDRARNAESATSTLAGLKGRRFVTMAESDTSGKLDEAVIKQYTGGEEITARRLYENAITFMPQFTMWLSCNDLPAVRDKSLFASDRVRVIEFNRHFTDEEQDKGLKAFFESDKAMQGIFKWLLDGYKAYKERGLTMPESMKPVMRAYAKDNDVVLQFLEDRCERDENTIKAKTLYDAYKTWCRSNGYYVCSLKKFVAEVTAHPEWYEVKGLTHGAVRFDGITLKEAKNE
jgi:putative DNA primase/helicase